MVAPHNLLLLYTIVAFGVFCVYLKAFWEDASTPKTDVPSWIVLCLSSLLWLLVLPIAWFYKRLQQDD